MNKIIIIKNTKKNILKTCTQLKEIGYVLSYVEYTSEEYIKLYFDKIYSKFEYDNCMQFLQLLENDLKE